MTASRTTPRPRTYTVGARVELVERKMRQTLLDNLPKRPVDASPIAQITGTVTEDQGRNRAQGQYRIQFDSGRVFWFNAADLAPALPAKVAK